MKLAFCLFNYFPYGGLQRDFLRIARICQARGHQVHVYTMRWDGNPEPELTVHILPIKSRQNHTRAYAFAQQVKVRLDKEQYDLVVGFNKMPHLDVYYAADVCYQARVREERGFFYRLLSRYRQWVAMEHSLFAQGQSTDILLISPLQQRAYTTYYQTEAQRFHLLPPGIAKNRVAPENAADIRQTLRTTYHIPADHFLLLMVGSGFKTKGVDRSLRALAVLPPDLLARTHLYVIGQDRHADTFVKLAKQLTIQDHVHFLGGRDDVPQFMLAADCLLHPAYHENTGTVLLEALAAGLPVLTVDVCGYAHYVQTAQAGIVLPSPFSQTAFNAALQKMVSSDEVAKWRQQGLAFAKQADIYSLPEKAVDLIEQVGIKRDVLFAR